MSKILKDSASQMEVTWEQATAFRLARHHLLENASRRSLLSVVRDMTGAQAQLLPAAQLSLWTRVHDLQPVHVERALNRRTLVRASCMRRTLFLVPAQDLSVFVRGSTGRAERELHWALGKGVPARQIDAAIDAALGVMHEPLTRIELAERTCRVLGVQPRYIHGGGWGSRQRVASVPIGELVYPVVDLLHLVASRGIVCYGPKNGGEATFVRADAWIPNWKDMAREQAESTLLRWYLHSFGPATPADFAMWSGVGMHNANAIWARERAAITSVDVEGWPASILLDDVDELLQARFERPTIRLLPYFDVFLFGHREKQHLAEEEHHAKIYRPQGWVYPVVLVDGRAAAVWEHALEKDSLRIRVTKFHALVRKVVAAIEAEAAELAHFHGVSEVNVQVE
jgi:hypothetical protein